MCRRSRSVSALTLGREIGVRLSVGSGASGALSRSCSACCLQLPLERLKSLLCLAVTALCALARQVDTRSRQETARVSLSRSGWANHDRTPGAHAPCAVGVPARRADHQIHALVDANGLPVALEADPGTGSRRQERRRYASGPRRRPNPDRRPRLTATFSAKTIGTGRLRQHQAAGPPGSTNPPSAPSCTDRGTASSASSTSSSTSEPSRPATRSTPPTISHSSNSQPHELDARLSVGVLGN